MTDKELIALLKKHPLPVGSVVAALLLTGAWYFRSSDVPEAIADVEKKSVDGQRLAANIQNAALLNEQLGAITTAGKDIEARLIRGGDLAKNLQYFYKLESDTGAKLTELRQLPPPLPKAGAPKTQFVPVGFAVGVQGEYLQILDFLRRLEHGTHYCRIVSTAVSGFGLERGPLKVNLTVELLGQP